MILNSGKGIILKKVNSWRLYAGGGTYGNQDCAVRSCCKAALAIKPKTPASTVLPFIDKLSMVLVMTVEPGFGGQSFMADMMPKIEEIRSACPDIDIEVDGGINSETIKTAAAAGANVFVAGSAVFKSEDPKKTIMQLKDNAKSVE